MTTNKFKRVDVDTKIIQKLVKPREGTFFR